MTDLREQLSAYDIPFSEVENRLVSWAAEALELRHGFAGDPDGALGVIPIDQGPGDVLRYLSRIQQRAARVDHLLAIVTQGRGRARRAQDQAKFEAGLAFDTATQENASRRTTSFVTREERIADASLDSLEQRRIAHRAERLVSVANEAYQVVEQVHWQLEALRKDARATLHALQIDSQLER
jgi:ribosomal protein L10